MSRCILNCRVYAFFAARIIHNERRAYLCQEFSWHEKHQKTGNPRSANESNNVWQIAWNERCKSKKRRLKVKSGQIERPPVIFASRKYKPKWSFTFHYIICYDGFFFLFFTTIMRAIRRLFLFFIHISKFISPFFLVSIRTAYFFFDCASIFPHSAFRFTFQYTLKNSLNFFSLFIFSFCTSMVILNGGSGSTFWENWF